MEENGVRPLAGSLKAVLKSLVPPSLWGFLRKVRYRWELAKFRRRTVTHRYGRASLQVYLTDVTSVAWYDFDWPAIPEVELLRQTPGARVFDLGAHECVFAMMLAEAVGPQGTVLAIEALQQHAQVGERNVRVNAYHNVQVLHAAATETSGKIAFTIGEHIYRGKEDSDGKVWVDGFNIDDLADRYGRPDTIFIDIEGYECRALHGAAKTLATNADFCIEMHVGCGLEAFGGSVEAVAAFFPADRYRLLARLPDDQEFFPIGAANGGFSDPRLKTRFFLVAKHI
jgi:FkbM family methyltransferase